METFHILHLAACWVPNASEDGQEAPPVHHVATAPAIPPPGSPSQQITIPDVCGESNEEEALEPPPRIRAAAAHMVFANRATADFITPSQVAATEAWTGRAILEALVSLDIPANVSYGKRPAPHIRD